MASGADDYADGGVHSLTMGNSELSTILQAAARRNQLVLVDFSASWCGPCRMMLPVLQQLAAEHRGRLAVIKVDCEQTPANQGLAQASGIRAFPTFHLYRNQQKVEEQQGANQANLRRVIQQQLAQLGPAAGGGGVGGSGGPGPLVTALAAALGRVKAGCSFDEFVAAAKTLLTFVGNVIDHPQEEKYRRVKMSNPGFRSKLGCRVGGKECMAALGFRELLEAGEPVLLLSEVPQELPRVRQLLQQALQQAEAAAAGAAAAAQRAAGAAGAPAAASAAAGTASASVGAVTAAASGTSAVDASALARAMAAALGGSTSSGTPLLPAGAAAAGASSRGGGGARPSSTITAGAGSGADVRRRLITAASGKGLARLLEKIMAELGIGTAPAQQRQEEHQPPPLPPPE